jgi:heat-inducible transcriptional repressor
MLSQRGEVILKSIVGQYIARAVPVPSQSITRDFGMDVSPATIRNEMALLEQGGYIIRPHISAGGVPSDRGYRFYVESLGDVQLPLVEQRLISHLFHQVEQDVDEWLHLAASITANMVQNVGLITKPKSEACQFKHFQLVSIQDSVALVVLVLNGARVREQLVEFEQAVLQPELSRISNKFISIYSGLTRSQISARAGKLSDIEKQVCDCILKLMEEEDRREYEDPYLDGLHMTLNQPELVRNHQMAQILMELVEQRSLLRSILPPGLSGSRVRIVIGKENEEEAIQDYSVIIGRYGLPGEADGTIGVIGPTRMPYGRAIAAVNYLASVLSVLIAKLYGRDIPFEMEDDAVN